MPPPRNPVQLAVIGAAHGIKGEVRVKSFTGDPLAIGDYGPLFSADGRAFDILDIRPQKEVVVVRFKGVADRDAAEALNGTALFVDRSKLPDDLDEEEFYHADLVGLAVEDETGARIGSVRAVQNFGGGDILEIALANGREALVPFTRAAVPHVDIAARVLTLDSVPAGLIGTEDDDPRATHDPAMPKPSTRKPRPDRPRGPKSAGGNR